MLKRLLVTGAAAQFGRAIWPRLEPLAEVVRLSNLAAPDTAGLGEEAVAYVVRVPRPGCLETWGVSATGGGGWDNRLTGHVGQRPPSNAGAFRPKVGGAENSRATSRASSSLPRPS